MIRKKELSVALVIALTLSVLMTVGIVSARPSDPTEGELDDRETTSGPTWGVSAYVWGYWIWYWMRRPPIIVFEEVYFEGSRWAGYPVTYTGELKFEYGYDGIDTTVYTDGSYIHTDHIYVTCNHAYCRASSWFHCACCGQNWYAVTPWAEISM